MNLYYLKKKTSKIKILECDTYLIISMIWWEDDEKNMIYIMAWKKKNGGKGRIEEKRERNEKGKGKAAWVSLAVGIPIWEGLNWPLPVKNIKSTGFRSILYNWPRSVKITYLTKVGQFYNSNQYQSKHIFSCYQNFCAGKFPHAE